MSVVTGAGLTQAYGILEDSGGNNNLITGNVTDSNGTAQLTVTGAASQHYGNIVSGALESSAELFPAEITPADGNVGGWTFDPAYASLGNSAPSGPAGTVNLFRVQVRSTTVVTNVSVSVHTAGSGLTSGENFVGLYNSGGALIGTSADQTTAWGSTGVHTAALAGGPFTIPPGFYWVAVLVNGTTAPAFDRTANTTSALSNFGFEGATGFRAGYNSTGQASLPSSVTPSASTIGQVLIWAALS